ncbi:MAG: hypothetical protein Q9166_002018 [cf. Caloplaca sp. 2 TL-2023]
MRPLYWAVARIFQRPLWSSCSVGGEHEVARVSYATKLKRRYWWSGQDSDGDKTKTTSSQAKDPISREASPLVQYRIAQLSTRNIPRRIHILGVGSIGGFVAHSLAGLPHPPPITLLLPSQKRLSDWHEQGQAIKVTTHGLLDAKLGFDVECVRSPDPPTEVPLMDNDTPLPPSDTSNTPEEEIIHNLIVSVKAFHTVNALKRVAHRLKPESSILFIQNGMGIIEEVNEYVFPDPTQRPQYMLGVISHGVYPTKPFTLVHSGAGTTALAIIPRNIEEIKPKFVPSALYLLRTVTRSPVLAAVGFAPTDLLQLQIEKLAVNAIINPLTAIMGCLNGDLLYRSSISRVMRLLLAEICLVIRSLPELQGVPNVKMRFDIRRLEGQVVSIATRTAGNRSSTLQDISRGNPTEIEYITGYIVRRGEAIGIQCVLNYMIKHMVKAIERMEGEKHGRLLPVERRDSG